MALKLAILLVCLASVPNSLAHSFSAASLRTKGLWTRKVADGVMLVSGVSGLDEMCLVTLGGDGPGSSGAVGLESCKTAVANGQGRELWNVSPAGKLSTTNGACVTVVDGRIAFADCATSSTWEALGGGELKAHLEPGELCLSFSAYANGVMNVATSAAVSATSSSLAGSHGASMAVDNSPHTFYASEFSPVAPVSLVLDLGSSHFVDSVEIVWKYPASAFSVSVSNDGSDWSQVYVVDSNILNTTRLELAGTSFAQMKIDMQRSHPVWGRASANALFGVSAVRVFASPMQPILAPCTEVVQSKDARGKVFIVNTKGFDPAPEASLKSEVASMHHAAESLSARVLELQDALSGPNECTASKPVAFRKWSSPPELSPAKLQPKSVATANIDMLLREARAAILIARATSS